MDITSYKRSRLRPVVCGFMVIPVLVNSALWIFSWINMDLVLGSRLRKLMFPITWIVGIIVHTIWRIYSAIVYQMSWQDE